MAIDWSLVSPWTHGVSARGVRQELEELSLDDACEVYRIRHRSVFKTSIPPLGEVAVKEIRHLRLRQRFRLRGGGRSKGEREFRNAQELHARGVQTPIPYAIGLDRDWLGLRRVIQIYEWLPGAKSLTECVRRGESPWVEVSDFVWRCAQTGLVHHGHSSENLLRCEGRWHVIDLADSRFGEGFQREGFVRDVARIARKLLRENALTETGVEAFINAIIARSRDTALGDDIPKAMKLLVEEGRQRSARSR